MTMGLFFSRKKVERHQKTSLYHLVSEWASLVSCVDSSRWTQGYLAEAVPPFLIGVSWCLRYTSLSEVPTVAHSSSFSSGPQPVLFAAQATPEQDSYTARLASYYWRFLDILSKLTEKQCSATLTATHTG